MIILTDRKGHTTSNAKIIDIQKAFNDLFLSKSADNPLTNYVSLTNDNELELQIYKRTIIIQDWGGWKYDGPGGPGEILRVRYKEGSFFNFIEKALDVLENEEREQLIGILQSLPQPN